MAQARRIVWLNVVTVISAAILIGAEVFGAAFAGSWALATLFDLGNIGARVLDITFVACGAVVPLDLHVLAVGDEVRIAGEIIHKVEHPVDQVRHVPLEKQIRHAWRAGRP